MTRFAHAGLVFLLAAVCQGASARAPEAKPAVAVAVPAQPAARPADVASLDSIMAALYEVVSGPKGKPRDWDRLHSLFAPDGKMGAVSAKKAGGFAYLAMSVDDYIARVTKPFSEEGFYETELARTSDTFGQITQVFSTYEARKAPSDVKPFMRGVNSVQLYHDGSRWWIISVLWRAEDNNLILPERYLNSH